jgi:hypothetical protein
VRGLCARQQQGFDGCARGGGVALGRKKPCRGLSAGGRRRGLRSRRGARRRGRISGSQRSRESLVPR